MSKGRWPRRSSWRHIRFSDYIAIVFVFTVYCILGTSLLLWIYAPIYSYHCPYKHYLLPMCFKCLYILPLYILCIYSLCIESRGPATFWCKCYLFYNVPTINKIFLLLLLLLLLLYEYKCSYSSRMTPVTDENAPRAKTIACWRLFLNMTYKTFVIIVFQKATDVAIDTHWYLISWYIGFRKSPRVGTIPELYDVNQAMVLLLYRKSSQVSYNMAKVKDQIIFRAISRKSYIIRTCGILSHIPGWDITQ